MREAEDEHMNFTRNKHVEIRIERRRNVCVCVRHLLMIHFTGITHSVLKARLCTKYQWCDDDDVDHSISLVSVHMYVR